MAQLVLQHPKQTRFLIKLMLACEVQVLAGPAMTCVEGVLDPRDGARGRGFIQDPRPIQSVVSTDFTWNETHTTHAGHHTHSGSLSWNRAAVHSPSKAIRNASVRAAWSSMALAGKAGNTNGRLPSLCSPWWWPLCRVGCLTSDGVSCFSHHTRPSRLAPIPVLPYSAKKEFNFRAAYPKSFHPERSEPGG